MAKINLLPWREKLRQGRKQRFLALLGVFILGAGVLLFFGGTHIEDLIKTQSDRNRFVQQKIKDLDIRIVEIKGLKKRKTELLELMNVIQRLQGDRPVIVKVFDELVKVTPDGVFFMLLSMKNSSLTIRGVAESNNRISTLMRQFDESDWFDNPNLTAVNALEEGRGSSFDLTVQQVTPRQESKL
ncbi:MAG: PilN domain-containing protein [Endozoicomonadaceae bacterium]|nr:PilN domain-containing protein [Endozoicomonadaceae bacterium]